MVRYSQSLQDVRLFDSESRLSPGKSVWVAPRLRDLIEVEVSDPSAQSGESAVEWRLAQVFTSSLSVLGHLCRFLAQYSHVSPSCLPKPHHEANPWSRQVRRILPDGRFLACVFDPNGIPDEQFLEWYSKEDEGQEWRRLDEERRIEERKKKRKAS